MGLLFQAVVFGNARQKKSTCVAALNLQAMFADRHLTPACFAFGFDWLLIMQQPDLEIEKRQLGQ